MSSFTVFLYDAQAAIYKAMQCTNDETKQTKLKEINDRISCLLKGKLDYPTDEMEKK